MNPLGRCAMLGMWMVMSVAASTAQDRSPAGKGSPSQGPSRSAESARPESASPWQRYFRRLAAEYHMTAGDSKAELTLVKEPLLKWSQPVRGGQDGAVFVWLQDGRPAAVGTFFIWPSDEGRFGVSHELHALSTAIQGDWRANIRWRPGKDPIDWRALPEAPVPGGTKARQSAEARQLARRFAATTRNRAGQTRELRLLPRPFFEYGTEVKKGRWEGGALFSLAEGTDTEIVLWLEA